MNTGNTTAWHALQTDEVVQQLATNVEKGLDAGEATRRQQKYGPNRLPEGRKRGPLMRFLTQLNNILVYVLLGAGFVKLMLGLWLDAGGQGREGARLDPQHAFGRGADCARRRDAHDVGRRSRAGRHRAAGIG